MYICEECGFTTDEIGSHDSYLCDVGCRSYYERVSDECSCGGSFVEAKECRNCGEYIPESGYDYCKECLDSFKTVENALEYGKEEKDTAKINIFLTNFFTDTEIEEILTRELREYQKHFPEKANARAKDFWDTDESSLVDFLATEKGDE